MGRGNIMKQSALAVIKEMKDDRGVTLVHMDRTIRTNGLNWLRERGLYKNEGGKRDAFYRLVKPKDMIVSEHFDDMHTNPNVAVSPVREMFNPISRGRHLPTLDVIDQFSIESHNLSRKIALEKNQQQENRITELSIALNEVNDRDSRRRIIQELARLDEDQHRADGNALVQAMQQVSTMAGFNSYDWSTVVSFKHEDYTV